MANLARIFISQANQRAIAVLAWLVFFTLLTVLTAIFAAYQVQDNLSNQTAQSMQQYARLRSNVLTAFEILQARVTATPCSAEFQQQLRKIAYMPDGISEFIYAPKGIAQCAVNHGRFLAPIDFGTPDIDANNPFGVELWLDRDLGFLDLPGLTGIIVRRDRFAVVIPPQKTEVPVPAWMSQEVVIATSTGNWWHSSGDQGIYKRAEANAGNTLSFFSGAFQDVICDPIGVHCVATEVTLSNLLAFGGITFVFAIVACALLATLLARFVTAMIKRYWAFEARFKRHLSLDSVVCTYQPVLSLHSGLVSGCEVLARWRDVDGTIVYPDQFLHLLEKHNLTRSFTTLIAKRAHMELSDHLPEGGRLQVNVNIFPRDLDAGFIEEAFAPFINAPGRFDVVIELVESDEINPDTAQREIEALRHIGIKTYIDDFGVGYSNIHNLAALSVDGVKLDRGFAMAPDGSVMAKMLTGALEMMRTSGRIIVVEGVETEDRLTMLKQTGFVDFAQGYLISRPIDIEHFTRFVAASNPAPKRGPRLVA
jgi:sensor c-di-GMP phosphodiesterase-like protein